MVISKVSKRRMKYFLVTNAKIVMLFLLSLVRCCLFFVVHMNFVVVVIVAWYVSLGVCV